MTHGSLFSGIGGFELAAEWSGFSNLFSCEIDPWNRRVLKYQFPQTTIYEDVKTMDATKYNGRVDILSGGFPCQPYSLAGVRKGKDDERHLWPEMLRIIREVQPLYVVGENVRGLINWSDGLVFDEVQADLEASGYEVLPFVLPAAGIGAPHRRDRVWFVAHARSANREPKIRRERREQSSKRDEIRDNFKTISNERDVGNTHRGKQKPEQALQKTGSKPARICGRVSRGEELNESSIPNFDKFPTQPPLCGGDDGLPRRLDGVSFSKWRNNSVKAYGNAIVPQVAYQIFETIKALENERA